MALSAKSPGRHYQQSFDTMFTNYLNRVLLESNDTFLQAIDSRTERRFSGNTKCILENRP
jgi:hypothetical protein